MRRDLRQYALGLILMLVTTAGAIAQTAPGILFGDSVDCALCHDRLTDATGRDLTIFGDWKSTMMANSFLDPVFRAKVESEVVRNPQLQSVIEHKCTTCHAPMAHNQALWDGDEAYSMAEAELSPMAADGVSCTLCHQIQDVNLGAKESFSGHYTIDDRRVIYGPYENVIAGPMVNHVQYVPQYGAQIRKAELCATCHTLFTPVLGNDGQIAGEFPEQTPYLEWLNSDFSADSAAGRSCQDCHMPAIQEGVVIASMPPWLSTQHSPFWLHPFVGGNTLVPQILEKFGYMLGSDVEPAAFAATGALALENLRRAALVRITDVQAGRPLRFGVEVANLTGHKFPTGFPSRRAWLHVTVREPGGAVVFESGGRDEAGRIIGLDAPYEPHHGVIESPQDVQIYEGVMGDVDGELTHTLLRAAQYLKDNRIPPKGFQPEGPRAEHIEIHGAAATDADFNRRNGEPGSGADRVWFEVDAGGGGETVTIEVELCYETLSTPFAEDLMSVQGERVEMLRVYLGEVDRSPVVIATDSATVDLRAGTSVAINLWR